jgi:hypothetical protein
MSRSMPLIHAGVTAPRIYRSAQPPGGLSREIERAASPASAALMRDLLTIIDFDLNVQYYQRQPVSVEYTDPSDDGVPADQSRSSSYMRCISLKHN